MRVSREYRHPSRARPGKGVGRGRNSYFPTNILNVYETRRYLRKRSRLFNVYAFEKNRIRILYMCRYKFHAGKYICVRNNNNVYDFRSYETLYGFGTDKSRHERVNIVTEYIIIYPDITYYYIIMPYYGVYTSSQYITSPPRGVEKSLRRRGRSWSSSSGSLKRAAAAATATARSLSRARLICARGGPPDGGHPSPATVYTTTATAAGTVVAMVVGGGGLCIRI